MMYKLLYNIKQNEETKEKKVNTKKINGRNRGVKAKPL